MSSCLEWTPVFAYTRLMCAHAVFSEMTSVLGDEPEPSGRAPGSRGSRARGASGRSAPPPRRPPQQARSSTTGATPARPSHAARRSKPLPSKRPRLPPLGHPRPRQRASSGPPPRNRPPTPTPTHASSPSAPAAARTSPAPAPSSDSARPSRALDLRDASRLPSLRTRARCSCRIHAPQQPPTSARASG